MATKANENGGSGEELKLHGLLAEFDNVDDFLDGCVKVRDAGYTRWDSHTPFPVHGVEEAMGIRMTILPWIVLGGGLAGLGIALLMQWWMNAVDYPYLISGKPYFSLPANIPVCFELTVLLSAFAAFFSVLGLNLLPQLYHPLFRNERFKRATDDRFFIAVDAADPAFNEDRTRALLTEQSTCADVEQVMDAVHHAPLPKALIYAVAAMTILSWIPLALIVRARYASNDQPRIHLIWDMDYQPKYKEQSASPLFADGRSSRPQVTGTMARGDFIEEKDLPFFTGMDANGEPVKEFPVEVNEAMAHRGRERYGVFCAPCHGLDGAGQGPVTKRVVGKIKDSVFIVPTDYHTEAVRIQPVGQLYNSITNGVRTMPAYGSQIPPADRWAIILYIRALQRSQNGTLSDVPPEKRAALMGN